MNMVQMGCCDRCEKKLVNIVYSYELVTERDLLMMVDDDDDKEMPMIVRANRYNAGWRACENDQEREREGFWRASGIARTKSPDDRGKAQVFFAYVWDPEKKGREKNPQWVREERVRCLFESILHCDGTSFVGFSVTPMLTETLPCGKESIASWTGVDS